MYKRWHGWVFTETDGQNGFVRTYTPMCVDEKDNRGVAVYHVDWDDKGNMKNPVLKHQNV